MGLQGPLFSTKVRLERPEQTVSVLWWNTRNIPLFDQSSSRIDETHGEVLYSYIYTQDQGHPFIKDLETFKLIWTSPMDLALPHGVGIVATPLRVRLFMRRISMTTEGVIFIRRVSFVLGNVQRDTYWTTVVLMQGNDSSFSR
jgi:hypothetical protein